MYLKNLIGAAMLSLALSMSGIAFAQQSAKTASDQQSTKNTAKHDKNLDRDRDAARNQLTHVDKTFMKDAAEGGAAEIQLGQLAEQKASDPQVKQFAERMVTDHQKAADKLKDVAQKENVTLPDQPSAREKAEKERLEKLSGADFDKTYMNHMVGDHAKDVTDFRKEASNSKDDSVRQFASSTLPTLQDHLKEARQIDTKIGGKTATSKKKMQSSYR